MRTREDIEAYFLRTGLGYEEVAPNTWVLRDPSFGENIVVRVDSDLVVFRMKVLALEGVTRKQALFEKLLELNANEMLQGAYGIADGAVVITDTLRLENVDYNEFQATLDDFTMALSKHFETLSTFRDAAA